MNETLLADLNEQYTQKMSISFSKKISVKTVTLSSPAHPSRQQLVESENVLPQAANDITALISRGSFFKNNRHFRDAQKQRHSTHQPT